MKLPRTISGWCLLLFFLWYGLANVGVSALMASPFPLIGALLALGYVVFSLIGR